MEGNLHKWTNYWKGWQLRYFVLKEGILYYYNTKEESNSGGCKRFFKISMFDIIVNKSDPTRVDLIIPNEQYLYLRALDYKERQKWLVALASQKATTGNMSNIVKYGTGSGSTNGPQAAGDEANHPTASSSSSAPDSSNIRPAGTYDLTYLLKIKQSELRLYCDLLSQQTHEIKNLVLSLSNGKTTTTTTPSSLSVESKNNLGDSTSSFKSVTNEEPVNVNNNEDEDEDELFVDSNTSMVTTTTTTTTATPSNEKYQIIVDSENVKKMDELSSNLNITCDMLVTIIKNLVILSNTSTNVSSDAVQSLLKDLSLGHQYHDSLSSYLPSSKNNHHQSLSSSSKSSSIPNAAASTNDTTTSKKGVDESDLHLYHPMYSNQQLNQYKKSNKMLSPSVSSSSQQQTVPADNNTGGQSKICRIESVVETQLTAAATTLSNEPDFLLGAKNNQNESHNSNSEDSMFRKKKDKANHGNTNNNNTITTTTETCLVATSVTESDSNYSKSVVTVLAESHTTSLTCSSSSSDDNEQSSVEFDSFFAKVRHRFLEMKLLEDNGIPSEPFLDCCAESFSILDTFGSTAFLPVKIDVYGNINKLRQKYATDPARFVTLQAIVQQEVDEKLTQVKNSGTDALMWLRRALWFICEFLKEFSKSTSTVPSECLYTAYHATVKRYHNWVVRGIFALALRAMPDKETFIRSLLTDPSQYDDEESRERLMQCICNDVEVTMRGTQFVIDIIKDFYIKNNLEV